MQKLNYRDKVIILVVLIIAVGVAGFFLLIKPKMEDVDSMEISVAEKQAEWDELEANIKQIDFIKERIQTKYDECVELGSQFVDLERSFDLENYIKPVIDKNGMYVKSNAAFTDASITTLMPYTLDKPNISYSIGESADLNKHEEESTGEIAETPVENQSLPRGTISIDFVSTRAGLMQFLQDIRYCGKSIEVTSLSLTGYTTDMNAAVEGALNIDVYYAKMISDLDIGAQIEAANEEDKGTSGDNAGTENTEQESAAS